MDAVWPRASRTVVYVGSPAGASPTQIRVQVGGSISCGGGCFQLMTGGDSKVAASTFHEAATIYVSE